MAEKKTENTEKKVFIKLRKNPNPNAPQEEFFSYNFTNYIIKRGEEVEIPEGLAKMIEDNEATEEASFRYIEEQLNKNSEK